MRGLALLLVAASAFAQTADRDRLMTLPEYRKGLKELRAHFEKRNEDPRVAEVYIRDLETAFPVKLGENVPVTKGVFDAFMRYQAAWARKTRDSKNANVAVKDLTHEFDRAKELKAAFKAEAEAKSPRFYRAFQAAVADVRALKRRDAGQWKGDSAVFFADQIDDSYTHVDAGNEKLEKGDVAGAVREADAALRINPGNADALVLRAGAEYDAGSTASAIADAQSALVLDPTNPQAQAILSLTASDPAAARAALVGAAGGGASLASDGGRSGLPRIVGEPDKGPVAGETGRGLPPLAKPTALALTATPTATPAVAKILAADLSVRAVGMAAQDPQSSVAQLGAATRLDPENKAASGWYQTMANRTGDYSAALGSAQKSLTADPNDALAYYNKAYALAGEGDKAGSVAALREAARIDPSYQKALDQALTFDEKEGLELMFSLPAFQRQPEAPAPRRAPMSLPLKLLGAVGAMMAFGALYLFSASSRGTGPAIVRR